MFLLRFILLLGWCVVGYAAQKTESNLIYARSSQLTAANINQAVEILRDPTKVIAEDLSETLSEKTSETNAAVQPRRDPTQMSGNFRQALKSYSPSASGGAVGTGRQAVMPVIALAGKIYVPPTATSRKAISTTERSSVALAVNDQIIHLKEGDSCSVVKDGQLITLTVEAITEQSVTVKLQPGNETLILH